MLTTQVSIQGLSISLVAHGIADCFNGLFKCQISVYLSFADHAIFYFKESLHEGSLTGAERSVLTTSVGVTQA